jgi:hypothetical protein
MEPRGRERHRWANPEVEVGGSTQVSAGNERVSIEARDCQDRMQTVVTR